MTAAAFDAAPICRIEGCERTDHSARGLCEKHYEKWRVDSTPERQAMKRRNNAAMRQRSRGTGSKHGLGRCDECSGLYGVTVNGTFKQKHLDANGEQCRGHDLIPAYITEKGPAVERTIPRQRDSHTEVLPTRYPDFDGSQPCATDPEWFFPAGNDHAPDQRAVCRGCAFVQPCGEWGLAHPEEQGVWGGMTEEKRKDVRKRMRRVA